MHWDYLTHHSRQLHKPMISVCKWWFILGLSVPLSQWHCSSMDTCVRFWSVSGFLFIDNCVSACCLVGQSSFFHQQILLMSLDSLLAMTWYFCVSMVYFVFVVSTLKAGSIQQRLPGCAVSFCTLNIYYLAVMLFLSVTVLGKHKSESSEHHKAFKQPLSQIH